jgi:rare lipoprotein A
LKIGPILATAWIVLAASSCSLAPNRTKTPSGPAADGRPTQTGIASWYGPGFHGRLTASGIVYDQNDLTAAHQTLPLGTQVMVTNLDNGKAVEVMINDRGPFVKGRIIDLSYAAARSIGMIGPGTIPVRVEVIGDGNRKVTAIPDRLTYTLQVGSFTEFENARRLRDWVKSSLHSLSDVSILPLAGQNGVYYRVQTGSFASREEAQRRASEVARRGLSVIIVEKQSAN